MRKRNQMPIAQFQSKPDMPFPLALDKWNPDIKAADTTEKTINILDPIGYDWWTDSGITAKTIGAQLKSHAGADIVVNINSPGGDVFEGLAIYNLMREYTGHITVRVLGIAASAASFIAMAADEVQIARAGFFMIHNAWTGVIGDRNDMRDIADFLEQIDATIADIYHIKTGIDVAELADQMDKETWITGKSAVDTGFADGFLASDAVEEQPNNHAKERIAAQKLDLLMAKAGMTRSERRNLIKDLKSTPSATQKDATHDAGIDLTELMNNLQNAIETIKSK
jgi:ATP-dependent Clp protease, protease subunit